MKSLLREAIERENRTWRIGRTTAGVIGLAFAVVYLIEGQELDMGRMAAPGPGIFPMIVGVLLALVSLGVIADAWMTRLPARTIFPNGSSLRRLATAFGLFLSYALLFTVLGFLVATPLLVAGYSRVVGQVGWGKAAASGVAVTAGVWAVFTLILGVRLPAGLWG